MPRRFIEPASVRQSRPAIAAQDGPHASAREMVEILEQQAATADILRVISRSPNDVTPVFDTIVRNATRLCEARFAFVMLCQGERLTLAARTACTPAFAEYLARGFVADPHTTVGRATLARKPVQVLDFMAEPGMHVTEAHRSENVRTVLAVPLMRDDEVLGVIATWRHEVRQFSERQIKLLETFADQAVIAIENCRLFAEIQEKRRQLELAQQSRSRFLAAATHDLRQPLHALTLFVAQLREETDPIERCRLIERVEAAVGSMNELFGALLDMSRLEAGMLAPTITEFPIQDVLTRMKTAFSQTARDKGLRLRLVRCSAWIRSDFVLLERILLNLVANAVRYTPRGGVLVGCRRRGARLRVEVWDSGTGIANDDQQKVFEEFYRVARADGGSGGGLGLGLSIVERLSRLLDHPIEVASMPGKGSCFSVSVPQIAPRQLAAPRDAPAGGLADPASGKAVVVIDDDPLVLEAMAGILLAWGCRVVTADSGTSALSSLRQSGFRPDLIIADYRLADTENGIRAIEHLREAIGEAVPALLVSGDTGPERLREASASGHHLLHKPVPPMTLRAMLNRLLGSRAHRPAVSASRGPMD